jgi:hypothetical protein
MHTNQSIQSPCDIKPPNVKGSQRALCSTHSEAYPDAHSPQRGLGYCTLLLPKCSEGDTTKMQDGPSKDTQHNTDSIRTSCTPYTQYTTKRHTLEHTGDTLQHNRDSAHSYHSRRRQTESAATVCATHTVGVNP